jgi:AbrB family looped-hinge helix DNA binding protein
MADSRIVRPLRGGQITIPAEFRERLGIDQDTLLQMTLDGGELRLRPVEVTRKASGSPWLKELYDLFEPIRREGGKFSSEEIDEAIDEAFAAVRRKQGA